MPIREIMYKFINQMGATIGNLYNEKDPAELWQAILPEPDNKKLRGDKGI